MNKPDDVSAEAWEVVAEHHGWLMECWPSTAMKLPSVTFDQLARSLDAAIQSAVEVERYRCARVAMNPGFIHAQDSEFDMGVNFAKSLIANAILDSK